VKELCNNKYLLNLFALIIVPLFCISCSSEVSVDILKKEKSRQTIFILKVKMMDKA